MAHRDPEDPDAVPQARRCTGAVGEDLGSDHLPQAVAATVSACRQRRIHKARWALHKANWTKYAEACESAPTSVQRPDRPVDEAARRLTEVILEASRRHISRSF